MHREGKQPTEERPHKEAPKGVEDKKELRELHERLAAIIHAVSGKPHIAVTTEVDPVMRAQMAAEGKNAEEVWYNDIRMDPQTREEISRVIHIPAAIVESGEKVAKGKAAHEAGHVAITRYGNFIPDRVAQELGFQSACAALEERATDQAVREGYPGAGGWIDAARRDETKREKPEAGELNAAPKFSQLCSLLVYAPHHETLEGWYDPKVIELYEALKNQVEKFEHTLPEHGAEERKVVAAAKDRYRLMYKKIWPKIRELVEEDLANEEVQQMFKERQENETIQKALEKIDKEALEELQKLLETMAGEGGTEDKPREGAREKEQGEQARKMHTMTEALREELRKAFDGLPEELKEALKAAARKALEELEDEITKKFSSRLSETPPETHGIYHSRKATEAEKRKQEEERAAQERETARRLEEADHNLLRLERQKSDYDRVYQEVRKFEEELYERLEEIFVPNVKGRPRLYASGAVLNLPAVFRRAAERGAGAKTVEEKIFEVRKHPERADYAIILLVDLSSSMQGETIKETFKGIVMLAEVLNRLGIKNEIFGFQDVLLRFKKFDQELNDDIRVALTGMPKEVENKNPGGNNSSAFNDDGPCLREASQDLEKEPAREKVLMVFSDGRPLGRRSTAQDLTDAVSDILKTTDQKLIGIGLGGETEHVTKYYPAALPNIRMRNLPQVLGDLLEDVLRHPEKYRPAGGLAASD